MPRTDAGIRSRLSRHQGGARLSGRLERVLAAKERTAGSADVPPTANNTRLVAVLADGMGGHTAGALASRMVCDSFISSLCGAERRASRAAAQVAHLGQRFHRRAGARQSDAGGHGDDAGRRRVRQRGRRMGERRRQSAAAVPPRRDRAAQRGPFAGARSSTGWRRRARSRPSRRRPTRAGTCCARR